MNAATQLQKSVDALPQSANRYQAVDLSIVDYAPADPFKGLHIGRDGDIVIVGIDGRSATLAVTAGVWPYGGSRIIRSGTTATGIVALY